MSDVFDNIIGHKKQLEYLKRVIKNGNASHAYCFSGPSSVGKYTIARNFVAEILESDEARLEIHPNVSIVDDRRGVLQYAPTTRISVEEIRDLRERLTLSTLGGGTKVAIIDGAHNMTVAAQNALLKTLEEPSGQTVIILVTEQPNRLLQTILSRSAHIGFSLVGSQEIKSELKLDDEIVALSAGRPGLAVKLMDDEVRSEFLEVTEQAKQFLKMPVSGRFTFIESLVKQKDTRDGKIKELVQIWRILIHNKLLKSLGIKGEVSNRNPKSYTKALRALEETESALRSNSNHSLALQHFALSF